MIPNCCGYRMFPNFNQATFVCLACGMEIADRTRYIKLTEDTRQDILYLPSGRFLWFNNKFGRWELNEI